MGVDSRNITIDYLDESNVSFVREDVECLGLDARGGRSLPFQVGLSQLGIGRSLGLLSDGEDSLGAMNRLLGSNRVGKPVV
jgi:hypothetical protein